jgi:ABC-type multidrug transport system fused ATPase/permease subunit
MNSDKITPARLKKYLSLFGHTPAYWILLLLIPISDVVINALNALLYRNIINAVTTTQLSLFYASIGLAGVLLVISLAKCLVIYSYMYQIRQIMYRLRVKVMTHLFRLPMAYFESHHTADSIQKLCFNVENIKTSLAVRHQNVLSPLIVGASAIVIILSLDLRMGLMVLALSVISVRVNTLLAKPLHGMAVKIQKLLASCTQSLTDILAGINIIKMFPGARNMVDQYVKYNGEVAADSIKRFRRMADIQAIEWLFGFLCNVVLLLIGIYMSAAGLIDIGTVAAILSLQGSVSFFLSRIGSAWGSMIESFVLADRVFEILDQPIDAEHKRLVIADEKETNTSSGADGGVVMKNTVFSYEEGGANRSVLSTVDAKSVREGDGKHVEKSTLSTVDSKSSREADGKHIERSERETVDSKNDRAVGGKHIDLDCNRTANGHRNVLDGIDLCVHKGETAALVGESGGGKSTVIKLLLGFYPVYSGVIEVLGKPLAHYTPEELSRNIAYVPQDAYLFATTIRENIRFGKLDASDEDVVAAAKRAFAHDFIMAFPNGYDTQVGERGESLSGGQRQRIAIARAFIKDAPLLFLDEATSALDAESEGLVQKGLEALMGGRTTLVVAHRLSTIEKADMIYVFQNGKICERGKHHDLMANDGVYKRLVALSKR